MDSRYQIEERDGKITFQSIKDSGDRVLGIFLLAISGLVSWWGFGGSFAVARLLEPLIFIRGAVTFAIAFSIFRLGAAVLFRRTVTEISTISGSVRSITKFLGRVKIEEYERSECEELQYRDHFAETAAKYPSVETSEVKMRRVYSLTLKMKYTLKGLRIIHIYSDNDGDKVRDIGERLAKILGVPLKEQKYLPKESLEKEVIFKNDGPTLGAIFEQKHESRDLYYSFYQVISETNDTLKLLELSIAQLGETGPGDRFGWVFPEIDALKDLPRDPVKPAEPSLHMTSEEYFDDDDLEDEDIQMDESDEPREVTVIRDGAVYRDRDGRAFQRWDGTRKPYREV